MPYTTHMMRERISKYTKTVTNGSHFTETLNLFQLSNQKIYIQFIFFNDTVGFDSQLKLVFYFFRILLHFSSIFFCSSRCVIRYRNRSVWSDIDSHEHMQMKNRIILFQPKTTTQFKFEANRLSYRCKRSRRNRTKNAQNKILILLSQKPNESCIKWTKFTMNRLDHSRYLTF